MNNRPNNQEQSRRGKTAGRESFGHLARALKYVGRYRRVTLYAYAALFIASAAQLAVPRLVRNIIDGITDGTLANMIMKLPADAQTGLNVQDQ